MASGKKRRRKKSDPAALKARIWIPIAAALLTAAVVVFLYLHFTGADINTSYHGLSPSEIPEMNIYQQTGFSKEKGLMTYDDDHYTSKAGIDISTYQKNINWKKVKKSGIEFVMIRVGYRSTDTGEIFKDKEFESNYKGAKKAGLNVGVYFFSQAVTRKEAKEEARFVVKNLRRKKIDYPVAFDMEDTKDEDRHEELTRKKRTEMADVFCQVIEENGYDAMIYAYPHWVYTKVDYTRLTRYNMWLAHYTTYSTYPFHYLMWQYTDKGKVPGISGKVDRDILFIRK